MTTMISSPTTPLKWPPQRSLHQPNTTSGNEAETDWVMGSDGYWWYHDKATNEWWYKDANGDIVKHP